MRFSVIHKQQVSTDFFSKCQAHKTLLGRQLALDRKIEKKRENENFSFSEEQHSLMKTVTLKFYFLGCTFSCPQPPPGLVTQVLCTAHNADTCAYFQVPAKDL